MKVLKINRKQAKLFIEAKHYKKTLGIFWEAFALVEDGKITGVVVYGQPSASLQRFAFKERDFAFYELTRLVIQSCTKNAASFLVGNSLKLLSKKPCAVVSYADTAQNHCGIVYQATNWIYTGVVKSHDSLYLIDGIAVHPMSLRDKGITTPAKWAKENGILSIKPKEKHRYFFFCGNKISREKMKKLLTYQTVVPYPKLDYSRYNDGEYLNLDYELHH